MQLLILYRDTEYGPFLAVLYICTEIDYDAGFDKPR